MNIVNIWYQLNWKIRYAITIIIMMMILQFSTMAFYTNVSNNKLVESEEKNNKNKIINDNLSKQNTSLSKKNRDKMIENVNKSIDMKNEAIKELYLNEADLSSNQEETVESFQNRSNIINYNLSKIKKFEKLDDNHVVNIKKKKYNFKINFFEPNNTFQLFENNQYIDKMNGANLKARNFNSKAQLTIKYMESLLPITKKEKRKTYQLVDAIFLRIKESKTKSILSKFLKDSLKISYIAKSSSWLEGGMPHTHDKTVILPESWFNETTSYFKSMDNKIAFNGSTLMHELVHIHQRIKPDLYTNIYREWGFIKVDFMDNMSDILEFNRNNPDGMQDKWIWVDRSQKDQLKYYWIGALYQDKVNPEITRVNYYAYQVNKIENTHENDLKIVRLSGNPPIPLSEFSSFNQYFGITNNHYHPNEIIAQYVEEIFGEVINIDEHINSYKEDHISNPAYTIFKIKWSINY